MTTPVDTWLPSLLLRKNGSADHWAVKTLVAGIEGREPIVITRLILQEVLAYFRDERLASRISAKRRQGRGRCEHFERLVVLDDARGRPRVSSR
jgi:hypothetical protein